MDASDMKRNHLTGTFTDADLSIIEAVVKKTKKTKSVVIREATMLGIKEVKP